MAKRRVGAVAGGTLVLDSDGVAKLAAGDPRAQRYLEKALAQDFRVVVASVTITEVMHGGPRDAAVSRVLNGVSEIVSVTPEIAQAAGKLLGASKLGGRCTVDSLVVAVAARQATPVVILTSDVDDITALVAETGLPKDKILVRHV